MKKIFGIQAELNITADEDIIKGLGKGLQNGSVLVTDIIKELKPTIIAGIKKGFDTEDANTTPKI